MCVRACMRACLGACTHAVYVHLRAFSYMIAMSTTYNLLMPIVVERNMQWPVCTCVCVRHVRACVHACVRAYLGARTHALYEHLRAFSYMIALSTTCNVLMPIVVERNIQWSRAHVCMCALRACVLGCVHARFICSPESFLLYDSFVYNI